MNFDTIWCWLIPLLVGLICGIIGYYWGKSKGEIVDNTTELDALKAKNTQLQKDLAACNKKLSDTKVTSGSAGKGTETALAAAAMPIFDADAAKAAFGKRIKQDDLKVVEGIGPKIEGLFHNFDIRTWQALSEASVAKCQEVLDSGGDRYRIHDPSSWPMQAKMAFEGKWKDLVKWQDEHKAGKF
ncbi:MAG: hypothetical protein AAF634_00975 [Bacteroidota bacterium]